MEGPTTLPFDYDNQNSMVATAGAGGGGASNFLANLPSRGLFSSTVLSSNPVVQFIVSNSCTLTQLLYMHSYRRYPSLTDTISD